jgi:hypothetical protein
MSRKTTQENHALMKPTDQEISRSSISLSALLSRLPNWALVPSLVGVFGLLLADLALADPLPIVDEAALLWALVSGMKVLGARRKARRSPDDAIEVDFDDELDVSNRPAPGQPLHVPQS